MSNPLFKKHMLSLICAVGASLALVTMPSFAEEEKAPTETPQAQENLEGKGWSPLQSWIAVEVVRLETDQVFTDPLPKNQVYETLQSFYPDTKVIGISQLKKQYEESALKTNEAYNNKRIVVLGHIKSITDNPGGIIELVLAGNEEGADAQTTYFRATTDARKLAEQLSQSPNAEVNCQYAYTDKGFVLRDCESAYNVFAAANQVVLKVRQALDGVSTDPQAIETAVQVEDIVKKISDDKAYPGLAEKCVPIETECANVVKQLLKDSTVLKNKEEFVGILCDLGYSEEDANKYFECAQK